ncbi:hypothetical protein NQ317_019657 [Molorchus minor]|uniref:Integrase catalytic domain-containing protein n=1 Tax=Molorchus minor TaxID=1323400 RepID=A0ABQ9J147_9CUCU|nr:hypothetical protein NQ317_019657 [Molorchus minor]
MRTSVPQCMKNCFSCQKYKATNLQPADLLQNPVLQQRFEIVAKDPFRPFHLTEPGTLTHVLLQHQPQIYPVYHPSANPVEFKNRDLKTQLAIYLRTFQNQWPSKLPTIRFAMNSTCCQGTGFTHAYLTAKIRSPADNAHDLRQSFATIISFPRHEEDRRKKRADTRRRSAELYAPGDKVLVSTYTLSQAKYGRSNKRAPKRDGPYVVLSSKGPCSYKIADSAAPSTVLEIYQKSTKPLS